jgi:transcriptional regulator with XRE-family HTH domain
MELCVSEQKPKVLRGERLKSLRESQELTERNLSQTTGLSINSISQYETGKTDPTPASLIKLAKALNTTTDYLYGLTDNPLRSDLTPDDLRYIESARRGDIIINREVLQKRIAKAPKPLREQIEALIAALRNK